MCIRDSLDPLWHEQGCEPFLVRWLAVNQFPVIHVIREKVLDTYVSNLLACRLQIWDAKDATAAAGVTFRLDPIETKVEIQRRIEQVQLVRELLIPLNSMETIYESLVDQQGNKLAQEFISQLNRLLEQPSPWAFGNVAVATRKMGRSAKQLIENFAEVHGEIKSLAFPRAA